MAAFLLSTTNPLPLFTLTTIRNPNAVTPPRAIAAGTPARRPCKTQATASPPSAQITFPFPQPLWTDSTGNLPPTNGPSGRRERPDDSDEGGGALDYTLALFATVWRQYTRQLKLSPLRTKSISAAFLVFLSDVLAQALSSSNDVDSVRLARFAIYGLLISGPQGHFWFQFLERCVKTPGTRGALMKVFLDQMTFSPVATASFFGIMKLAEGNTPAVTYRFLKDNLPTTLLNSYRIWPMLNMINFICVPVAQRVLFTSAASVFWVSFLSVVASRQSSV